jgi:hypothetical protein
MAKKVVPLPPRCAMPTNTASEQRVTIRLGKQRYALDIKCPANISPHERRAAGRVIETKFIRLRHSVALGEYIDGWRVCWVGGWDRGKVFFVAMVSLRDSQA